MTALDAASSGRVAASYSLHDLVRRFPGVVAVDRVNLTVRTGEIHGIIGRNGAGKSVLVNMVAGVLAPSKGEIRLPNGIIDAANASPARAHGLGISLIPQEPKFARGLSVTDNLFMGRQLTGTLAFTRPRDMRRLVESVIERLSIPARPNDRMGDLAIEAQQLLAFGKALMIERAKVVLLDEITASLTSERKRMLLRLLKAAASEREDVSFTLISHHINEIIEFTDRVTVMRDGRAVATIDTREATSSELASWIVGDKVRTVIRMPVPEAGGRSAEPLLEVSRLAAGRQLRHADFEVRQGEVVGFAGLEGSGKDEALEAVFGLRRRHAGEIAIAGVAAAIDSPRDAMRQGIAFLPKHREAHAIIHNRSVADNAVISGLSSFAGRLGFLDIRRCNRTAEQLVGKLGVKTPSVQTIIDNLSGGNKQKVLIGRLSLTRPRLMLLNEPTRGVDISAKPDLLKVIREELARHAGVVMISQSEEELVEICDRVYVFFKGVTGPAIERGTPHFGVSEIYRLVQGVTV